MKSKGIFRHAAIDSYSSSSQFEQHLFIFSYKNWMFWGGLSIILMGVIYWFFFGTMIIDAQGIGILSYEQGFANIESHTEGRIHQISIQTGEFVKKGEPIAFLSDKEINQRLLSIEKTIDRLEKKKALLLENSFLLHSLNEKLYSSYEEREKILHEKNNLIIQSPVSGKLIAWIAHPNQLIKEGDIVARMEIFNQNPSQAIVYGFLPLDDGKKVSLHSRVEVELSTLNSHEFGAIIGEVIHISQFPTSYGRLKKNLHNDSLIDYFSQGEPVIEVLVSLEKDSNNFSGYRWTTKNGAPIHITSGTLCTFKCEIEKLYPFQEWIPIWKIKKVFDK